MMVEWYVWCIGCVVAVENDFFVLIYFSGFVCMNMIDEDEEEEDGRRWRKVKKLGVDGVLLDLGDMLYLMVVILKKNQTIKLKKSNGLN